MFGQAAATAPANLNPNKDVQITPPLNDGISSLNFSPKANILVATSWDNTAYCWEINAQTAQAVPKASTSHSAPLLCSAWNADGTAVYTGGADKTVKLWNLATNQSQQVAAHDAPIRRCAFIPEINLLVTGRQQLGGLMQQHVPLCCCRHSRVAASISGQAARSSHAGLNSIFFSTVTPSCLQSRLLQSGLHCHLLHALAAAAVPVPPEALTLLSLLLRAGHERTLPCIHTGSTAYLSGIHDSDVATVTLPARVLQAVGIRLSNTGMGVPPTPC